MLKMREPVNTMTHLIGAVLSGCGMIWMLYKGYQHRSVLQMASALVFGMSLIALYTASTVYHWASSSPKVKQILRRVDHSMIYVLIAGTYTPVCLIALKGVVGWSLLGVVWGLALLGIIMKLVWFNAPRWLYTAFYLLLGWLSVFFIVPLFKALPVTGFILLLTGGLLYSAGSIIYAMKSDRLKISVFGFHEIFHMFVLGGSLSHFLMVSRYILI